MVPETPPSNVQPLPLLPPPLPQVPIPGGHLGGFDDSLLLDTPIVMATEENIWALVAGPQQPPCVFCIFEYSALLALHVAWPFFGMMAFS